MVDSEAVGQAPLAFHEFEKRRVLGKTAAVATVGLPLNPQITKKEQRLLRGVEKERKRKQDIEHNRAKARARRAVLDDPTLSHEPEVLATEIGDDEVDLLEPHPSHELRRMRSHDITYCNNCGKWVQLNQHSQLQLRCETIKRGYKHVLRLLQNDVVPGPGAQLPAAAKRKPGRKRA